MPIDSVLQQKYTALLPHLDERQRRLVAAVDARDLGYGGWERSSSPGQVSC